ncbi:MAG: hypothetical protein Q9207_001007 [Kuettlingeria erythrocarpa]
MSDPSEAKQASVPQWQQQQQQHEPGSSASVNGGSTVPEASQTLEPPPSRASLVEQASRFLQEDGIKDAPIERTVAFLESKGLTQEEIPKLVPSPPETSNVGEQEVLGTEEPSRFPVAQGGQSNASTPTPASQSAPSKDIPPIITYPEFLLHSRKPPPLVTASNLINTFYLFSGAAAAIYGTSKYIVDPMLESLTTARHSLFETAQASLDTLNEKLVNNVSKIPEGGAKQPGDGDGDNDSETTETIGALFNRTIGTQTSTPPTPTAPSTPSPVTPPDTISAHGTSLISLRNSLAALRSYTSPEPVMDELFDLKMYLRDLAYPKPNTSLDGPTNVEAVNKFKAELRGVKGVLLSARNFPSATGRAG